MCGIAGYTGNEITGVLAEMSGTLVHRGPDALGAYNQGRIHLAHRRLSIIDLAQGAQPMQTPDGDLCIIFNGEIYNHQTLRKELEDLGHKFQTDHSDTEVLLYAWREWGEKLVARLNGMWAFCIYDKQASKLFFSRDRYGQKPLYYSIIDGEIIFASELTALRRHPGIKAETDILSLKKYFAYAFVPAPRTIFKNISKLPAAHNMIFDLTTSEHKIWRYWDYVIEPFTSIPKNPELEWGEELRTRLSEAVKLRMISDVELGVLLSGGIDSSCIAAFAVRHAREVKTFSIGFDEDTYDESPYARQVSEYLGTTHYESRLSREEARKLSPEILKQVDEPFADDSLIPTWMVCREARKKVTVALGGDGGDELFCGYLPFKVWKWARRYNIYLPRPVHRVVEHFINKLSSSRKYMSTPMKLKRFFRASGYNMKVWVPAIMAPLGFSDICDLFSDQSLTLDELYSEAIEAWDDCASEYPADRMTQYYIRLYLQNEILTKGDRASMLNSLELRCPFLDVNVADFARRIPANYRYRQGQTKYLLKKSLEPLLPSDILYRGKQGFSPPTAEWFRNKELSFTFSGRDATIDSKDFFSKMSAQHNSYECDHTRYLWSEYMLDNFQR